MNRIADWIELSLRSFMIVLISFITAAAHAGTVHRTVVVREKETARFLDGAFVLRLLRIRGYSIKVRASGTDRVLRVGQSLSPAGSDCKVVFEEIASETRIARFKTDCP